MSPEEFSDFYAASFRRLVGQLYLMTGDHAEAQDAVQEAFVRAWAHRGKLDRLGAPEAWVRATAWHVAVSRWHRARLGRLLTRSQPRPQAVDGPTPDRVALIDALRQVPAEQRRALVLYHLCDLTVAQIVEETGAAAGTVKARLARGRAALAPHLREGVEPARPGPAGPGGGRAGHGSGPVDHSSGPLLRSPGAPLLYSPGPLLRSPRPLPLRSPGSLLRLPGPPPLRSPGPLLRS
ncbi:MAG TPA: SigE family RNA polymerase sigma factor, partial [Streptosporangiaceae bacterium]|nr:SigE family RNA polymerase sigma factor [Streptosporangiaceae bacterium]